MKDIFTVSWIEKPEIPCSLIFGSIPRRSDGRSSLKKAIPPFSEGVRGEAWRGRRRDAIRRCWKSDERERERWSDEACELTSGHLYSWGQWHQWKTLGPKWLTFVCLQFQKIIWDIRLLWFSFPAVVVQIASQSRLWICICIHMCICICILSCTIVVIVREAS